MSNNFREALIGNENLNRITTYYRVINVVLKNIDQLLHVEM